MTKTYAEGKKIFFLFFFLEIRLLLNEKKEKEKNHTKKHDTRGQPNQTGLSQFLY